MKEGDLILVSAEATGLGKPMEAVIDKIETFMGQTLVTVTYTQPDDLSGFGGCFVDKITYPFQNPGFFSWAGRVLLPVASSAVVLG